MKCKYEGSDIYNGRCMGTREIDPCPGYEKCIYYKPSIKTKLVMLKDMNDKKLAMTLATRFVDMLYTDPSMKPIDETHRQVYIMIAYRAILTWFQEPCEE